MSSYYRTINGQRYDADLLEMAEGLMEGRGDGRLSRADAEQLWESAFDGMGMTAIEMATLAYIRAHENPTKPAKEFFDAQGVGKEATNAHLSITAQLAGTYGFEELQLMRFDIEEIREQEALEGSVKFEDAYRKALEALFDPKHEQESPYHVLSNTDLEDGTALETHEDKVAKLKEFINYGALWLVPHDTPPNKEANEDYYPPENGESVKDNWIFNLLLDDLSDHLYWMVVPRNGGETIVYGFN